MLQCVEMMIDDDDDDDLLASFDFVSYHSS